ncbi:nickel transporter [Amylibacter marinus]|uniref:Nickel transporter n=1 Tax=Amylibacter marinus TaxID=1475483 RepID=A0ABQ5VW54_9RHOB|nr:Hpt domain-containing protein [Amylibacter marinus]GLQ35374.1 nickel transporter [Amylibacter marinus]
MINWDQVKQLEEDIGAEDFGDIVVVFIEEVDEAVDALREITSMGDDDMATALHFLKGSAANLGFADFAASCGAGEDLANKQQAAEVDLQSVVALYDASKSEFLTGAPVHTSYQP